MHIDLKNSLARSGKFLFKFDTFNRFLARRESLQSISELPRVPLTSADFIQELILDLGVLHAVQFAESAIRHPDPQVASQHQKGALDGFDDRLGELTRPPNLVDVNQCQHGALDPVVGSAIRPNGQ